MSPDIEDLVPRPSCFYLPFAYMGVEDQQKTGKAWEHSSHEWMRGGCSRWGGGGDIQIHTD